MHIAKISVYSLGLFLVIAVTINGEYLNSSCLIEATAHGHTQATSKEDSIENTIGVITLSDINGGKSEVQLFNNDDSLWYEFSFNDAESKSDSLKEDFRPFAFHRDYYVLALKCVGADERRFEVVVNETTGLRKYVRKNDSALKLETWEAHILNLFAVDFNQLKNPLMSAPTLHTRRVRVPRIMFFHPVEIKGNWLRVRWDLSEAGEVIGKGKKKSQKIGYGWIRWKENNMIIIERYYFA